MNGRQMTNIVPAAPQRRQRRKRGIVPKGGRAALSPKELKLHAQLVADGRLKSGRGGGYDFYVVNGKQRWRRHTVPKDPPTPGRGYARKCKAWQLVLQVPRLQRLTRSTSDRPQTTTRLVPLLIQGSAAARALNADAWISPNAYAAPVVGREGDHPREPCFPAFPGDVWAREGARPPAGMTGQATQSHPKATSMRHQSHPNAC